MARIDQDFLAMALVGYQAEKQRLKRAIAEVKFQLANAQRNVGASGKPATMTAAGRKRIAVAQKKRWAAFRRAKAEREKGKQALSAAGRTPVTNAKNPSHHI